MSTLYLAVSLVAQPGREDELRGALEALLAPSRADDGCLQYDLHVDRENPRHFFLYERWRDETAWRAHMEMPHLKRFGEISPALAESWTLHQLDRV